MAEAVSDTVAPEGAPYSQVQLDDLAEGLRKAGPFFLGNDVRSEESSKTVSKNVLETLAAIGFTLPSKAEPSQSSSYSDSSSSSSPKSSSSTSVKPSSSASSSTTSKNP